MGGFELGLERAGFGPVLWQVEIDQFCRAVLAHHWPDAERFEDVRSVSAESLPRIDLLCGGFPCQPVSVAGKRRGHEDDRWLWPEMLRLVREMRPRWVVAENVPGLRTLGADTVLEDLEAAGYSVWPLVVGADDVGAPHRRKRVWIVAHRNSGGRECERIAEPAGLESSSGHEPDRCDLPMAHAESRGLGERGSAPDERHGGDADGSNSRMDDPNVPRSGDPGQADSRVWLDRERTSDRRAAWPASPGQPQHEWEPPRCVTRVESGLGDVPDGFPWRLAPWVRRQALRALGNAVVPQVAEAIGRAIWKVELLLREKDRHVRLLLCPPDPTNTSPRAVALDPVREVPEHEQPRLDP